MKKNKIYASLISLVLTFSISSFATNLEDGIDLYKSKNYSQAIKVLKNYAKENPKNPEVHLWLARCYEVELEMQKAFDENKIYQQLRLEQINEEKVEEKPVSEPEPKKIEKEENTEPSKKGLIRLNNKFIRKTFSNRAGKSTDSNKKRLTKKQVKDLFKSIPEDTLELEKIYLINEIKSHYGIATHQEEIILRKAETEILLLEIDVKIYERDIEKDKFDRDQLNKKLTKLIKKYNKAVSDAEEYINKFVYNDSNPLSYEYYKNLSLSPDEHIDSLNYKRNNLHTSMLKTQKEISYRKSTILSDEKEIKTLDEQLPKSVIESTLKDLSGFEKEQLQNYLDLKERVANYKKSFSNYIKEEEILYKSLKDIGETIQKINPDYLDEYDISEIESNLEYTKVKIKSKDDKKESLEEETKKTEIKK